VNFVSQNFVVTAPAMHTALCYHPRTLTDQVQGKGFLQHCADAARGGSVWLAVGIVFFVLGMSRPSGAFIGLGAAFIAIAITRKRRRRSSDR
jgi:hypothetical protein